MSAFDFQIPRQAATLRTMVEDRLREAIITGHFKPRQRLVERELCELLDVGRTSLREALRQLEAEGLLTSTPHRGPTVSGIDYNEASQLYEVRIILEAFMGQEFATKASDANIELLSHALKELEKAIRRKDHSFILRAKTSFYAILMEGCQNIFVKQMLSLLHNRVNVLRMTSMTQPNRLQHSLEEVREIHDAIVARDGPRAAEACRLHIYNAAKAALSYLRSTSSSGN